jgi:hypothetical protein
MRDLQSNEYYEMVLMPIAVAKGKCCWGRSGDTMLYRCCSHFDNEGGHPVCKLSLGDLQYDKITGYVLKPEKCLSLRKV